MPWEARSPTTVVTRSEKEISMSSKDPTWISDWNPENETFWNSKGQSHRPPHLIWSIVAEHIGFSVWLIWRHRRHQIAAAGFHYTTDQLFQLVAIPGLIGSLMRFPYTFAVTAFGGRNWTIFSAAVPLHPTLGLAYFVGQPDTQFWLLLLVASTAGLAVATSLPAWPISPSSIPTA